MNLLNTFNALDDAGIIKDFLDPDIKKNLKFLPRDYQIKAINRFDNYFFIWLLVQVKH